MTNTCTRLSIALVLCVLGSPTALATDRFFPDQSAASPNGRYQLEAKSPDNAGEKRRPFARNFTYALTDLENGQELWRRQQPADESSPMGLFVNDQTCVVVHTSREELIALAPVTGERVLRFDILEQFPKDESQKHVARSTAGPIWAGRSRWYFLDRDATTYFVICTWWKRRVIADLSHGAVVKEIGEDLAEACDEADRSWALRILERDADQLPVAANGYPQAWEALTAIHLAMQLSLTEAVPLLRRFEQSEYVGSSSMLCSELTVRASAQLALRRLGEMPGDFSPFVIQKTTGDFPRGPIAPHVSRSDRIDRIDRVQSGISLKELVEAIGHPDAGSHIVLEYDVDQPQPFTLVVTLKQHGDWQSGDYRVDEVERVTPPLWQKDQHREARLILW